MAAIRELNGYEIPDELLDSLAGGVIIRDGFFYYVADDKDGHLIDGDEPRLADMQAVAEQRGLSVEVITPAEYQRRFGKAF